MRVDLDLVRRVEASAARQGELLAASMAQRSPSSGAASARLGGGAMVALGHGRYVNRGIGIDLLPGEDADEVLDVLETFFTDRGLRPSLEVSAWASRSFVAALASRGYVVEWFRDVFVRDGLATPSGVGNVSDLRFVEVDEGWLPAWSAILGEDHPVSSPARAVSDEFCDAAHHVPGEVGLLAVREGASVAPVAVGCGSFAVVDGIAWLGAAATLRAERGRGVQRALLDERLRRARVAGASIAAATALPDGASARNLRALGFEVLCSQAVMTRPHLDPHAPPTS